MKEDREDELTEGDRDIAAQEKALRALDSLDEKSKLIEVWKVLEALAVSMDRLGMYWHFNGEEAAKDALHKFMSPPFNRRIANARSLMVSILEAHYPGIGEELEKIAEDESQIGYWDGPELVK